MERPPPARRLSCSELPMHFRRSSDLSAPDPPRRSVGIPLIAPAGRALPADPSSSSSSCFVSAPTGNSILPNSMSRLAVASSSSFPGEKIRPLDGHSIAQPPEASSMPPQFTSGSAAGEAMICQPSLDDHFYDADGSSSGHSSGDLAARHSLSSLSLLPSLWAKIKRCDVYISMCGCEPSLLRFVNWLCAELQLHGVLFFASDRSRCTNAHTHRVAREAIEVATLGVVVITAKTFSSPYAMEELKLFLERGNLVAIFFGLSQEECMARDIIERRGDMWQLEGGFLWEAYGGLEKEWKEVVNGLSCLGCSLKAHTNNWRNCISVAVALVGKRLGRSGIIEKVKKWRQSVVGMEFPFPRNNSFVGRERELLELEQILFGYVEEDEHPGMRPRRSFGRSLVMGCNGGRLSVDLKGKGKELVMGCNGGRPSVDLKGKGKELVMGCNGGRPSVDLKGKGKEHLLGEGFGEEREVEGSGAERVDYFLGGRDGAGQVGTLLPTNTCYGKGIACICGESGIGKTELVLEFVYRFAQRYKMVLWIGGEARYLRQNYLNLLSALRIELGIESAGSRKGRRSKGFEELEERAICRLRKELMQGIPFLVVIDNLEGEKDWWDDRNLMDLLPPFGGETHVIISTRLPRVMDLKPMRLLYLSAAEALALMKGSLGDLPREEVSALKVIEEKLGRVPLGLAIVQAILSEVSIRPTKLLDAIRHMPHRDLTWSGAQDPILRYNPGMVQLLDVCFVIFGLVGGHGNLASRMVEACGWFAPSPVPVPLLVAVASSVPREHDNDNILKRWLHAVPCMRTSHYKQWEAKAMEMLVRFRIARCSTKNGFVHFHDMIKLYARKRGSSSAAQAMVQAISHYGSPRHHSEHIWAASFLLFNFGTDPAVISLEVPQLLAFIKKCILPLAWDTSTIFFRYGAAVELLHQALKALENARPPQLLEARGTLEKASRWRISKEGPAMKSDSRLYEEFTALQVTLLETMSKLKHAGPVNTDTYKDSNEHQMAVAANVNKPMPPM